MGVNQLVPRTSDLFAVQTRKGIESHRITQCNMQCTVQTKEQNMDSKANMRTMQKNRLDGAKTSTNRLATANFWCTFHHDGKFSPAWWGGREGARRPPPFTLSTTRKHEQSCGVQIVHKKFHVSNNNFYLESNQKRIKKSFILPQATALLGHWTRHSPKQRQAFTSFVFCFYFSLWYFFLSDFLVSPYWECITFLFHYYMVAWHFGTD